MSINKINHKINQFTQQIACYKKNQSKFNDIKQTGHKVTLLNVF